MNISQEAVDEALRSLNANYGKGDIFQVRLNTITGEGEFDYRIRISQSGWSDPPKKRKFRVLRGPGIIVVHAFGHRKTIRL